MLGHAFRMHLLLRGIIAAVTIAACSSITSTARGISVLLEANPKTAQLGDTVTFLVNVVANAVSGVTIDFGDTTGDQSSAGGAPTVQVSFKHLYGSTGTYLARAAVSDAAVGVRYVSQEIVVIPRIDTTLARR